VGWWLEERKRGRKTRKRKRQKDRRRGNEGKQKQARKPGIKSVSLVMLAYT
jgi:hypothetical protein